MSGLRTISPDLARAHVAALDLLLTTPGIDDDTERRAQWLRLRLVEIAGVAPRAFDMIEARIARLLPAEGLRRERESSLAA
jgi:hypothetical protein